jgi:hypothetical protein
MLSKLDGLARLEKRGKLKKYIDLMGSRTRDLPLCSTLPQPTTLPSAEDAIDTGWKGIERNLPSLLLLYKGKDGDKQRHGKQRWSFQRDFP